MTIKKLYKFSNYSQLTNYLYTAKINSCYQPQNFICKIAKP